jgi:hypothetical protein
MAGWPFDDTKALSKYIRFSRTKSSAKTKISETNNTLRKKNYTNFCLNAVWDDAAEGWGVQPFPCPGFQPLNFDPSALVLRLDKPLYLILFFAGQTY